MAFPSYQYVLLIWCRNRPTIIGFLGGVLIFGAGLEHSSAICSTAIYLCIGCYGTSKLFIYCFLSESLHSSIIHETSDIVKSVKVEKVHIVWSPTAGKSRFRSPVYIICMITVGCYGVIAALLLAGQLSTVFRTSTGPNDNTKS